MKDMTSEIGWRCGIWSKELWWIENMTTMKLEGCITRKLEILWVYSLFKLKKWKKIKILLLLQSITTWSVEKNVCGGSFFAWHWGDSGRDKGENFYKLSCFTEQEDLASNVPPLSGLTTGITFFSSVAANDLVCLTLILIIYIFKCK